MTRHEAPPSMYWHRENDETYVLRTCEHGNTGWVVRGQVYGARWMATNDGYALSSLVISRSGRSHYRVRRFGSAETAMHAVTAHIIEKARTNAARNK